MSFESQIIEDSLMIECSQTINSAIPEFFKAGVLYMDQEFLLEVNN
jgi:hypothetical protein